MIPRSPAHNIDELEEQAVKCTKMDADGNYEIMGFPVSMTGQAHPWFREVLLRQFGQEPYSDDYKHDPVERQPGRLRCVE